MLIWQTIVYVPLMLILVLIKVNVWYKGTNISIPQGQIKINELWNLIFDDIIR